MANFYENEYYQKDMACYKKVEYSEDELFYMENLCKEKICMFEKCVGVMKGRLLDIGCGEGYALKSFYKKGWDVTGVDFSEFGIKTHNPHMLGYFIKGDLIEVIQKCDEKYDLINMDNVLEHLPDPKGLMNIIKSVCHDDTIICIKVPNDFSITQINAYNNGYINDAFWVTDKTSEHFSYFTLKSLKKLSEESGYMCIGSVSNWPIDFNMFNPRTNFYRDKSVGHDGHIARIFVENMLFAESIEKTLELHQALANLGMGRNISVYLKRMV